MDDIVRLLLLGFLTSSVSCDPEFTTEPDNTTVNIGGETTLNCAVSGLPDGEIFTPSWLKSGQALSSGRNVGGHPRYSITGDPATEGNLLIQNVQLGDDTSYQCKVNLIRGPASRIVYLKVQEPPETPTFDIYQNATAITITPPEQVVLTCRANNAKPVPTITWLKDGASLVHDTPTVVVTQGSTDKLSSVASTLTLDPEKQDNGIVYTCLVSHPALEESHKLWVTLNVLFPPGPPSITSTGFVEGMQVQAGTELSLQCQSKGGNPLADVFWWKNEDVTLDFSYITADDRASNTISLIVDSTDDGALYTCKVFWWKNDDVTLDFSYITADDRASNTISLIVDSTDDGAVYTCKVTSIVLEDALTESLTLQVVYAPAYVNITGHENMVKSGDVVTLTCTSAASNPRSTITWNGAGTDVETPEQTVTDAPNGGYITTRTITLTMSNTVTVMCVAQNNLDSTHTSVTVSVMYPPGMPQINANLEGLRSGRALKLSCSAFRGNPLADLTWYKNGEEVTTADDTVKAGSTATREISFIMDKSDNGANYSCNATNAATTEPLQAVETLHVLFPPDSIDVTAEPAEAKEGDEVKLTCQTESSNPESDVAWWQEGVEITGGDPVVESGEFGGFITRSELTLPSVTSADNGDVFKCSASNPILTESTIDAIKLDIRYKPKISTATGISLTSGEVFSTITLECAAVGNPESLSHEWKLNDNVVDVGSNDRLSLTEEGALVIQNVTRDESGKFMCLVSNDEGTSNITASINVNYSPAISSGETVTLTLYTVGEIVCQADAHPKPDNFITWERAGFDLSGFQHEFAEDKSTMRILNVSLADGGLYTCIADNGIAPATKKDVVVVVQYKPQIDHRMQDKVAQSAGQPAILKCGAEGAPEVIFTWQRNGQKLNMTSDRYALDTWKDVKYTDRYESRLIISHVNENYDYGTYQCKVHNDLGEALFTVQLEKTSAPEAPSDLTVVSVSHDSVTLKWVPGFNGGLNQTYTVRFSRKDTVQYQYVDSNTTTFTVTNLSPGTEYEITVRGKNKQGTGKFFAGIVTAVTDVEPTLPTRPATGILVGDLPLYLFLLVVFFLLLSCIFINIFLCCCLVKKRKNKKNNKSGTSGVQLEKVDRRGSDSAPPTEAQSLSDTQSERDRGYSTDEYDNDSRRYSEDYSHDYSVSDRFDDDHRPIYPSRGSPPREYRQPEPGYYNSAYRSRPGSYAPSWDSYGNPPSIGGMTADSRLSEEQDERDYVQSLRRKQRQGSSSRVGALVHQRGSATPSPVPSSIGNFVQLTKGGGKATASVAGSEEGFLV